MSEYQEQAEAFLKKTKTKLAVTYKFTGPHFSGETDERDVYVCTLSNEKFTYSFEFGDSIHNSQARVGIAQPPMFGGISISDYADACKKAKKDWKKPGAYDVLSCLTSYDPGTFRGFCGDYGYDDDSRKAMDLYLKIQGEYESLTRLFTSEELGLLGEIQ